MKQKRVIIRDMNSSQVRCRCERCGVLFVSQKNRIDDYKCRGCGEAWTGDAEHSFLKTLVNEGYITQQQYTHPQMVNLKGNPLSADAAFLETLHIDSPYIVFEVLGYHNRINSNQDGLTDNYKIKVRFFRYILKIPMAEFDPRTMDELSFVHETMEKYRILNTYEKGTSEYEEQLDHLFYNPIFKRIRLQHKLAN